MASVLGLLRGLHKYIFFWYILTNILSTIPRFMQWGRILGISRLGKIFFYFTVIPAIEHGFRTENNNLFKKTLNIIKKIYLTYDLK